MRSRTLLWILLLPALFSACSVYRMEKELTPPNAEFLAKVRYLITSEERRDFLAAPDADKPAFIEAFWKRRDPDPTTEENELRVEYEIRVEAAAKLFPGEGQPGYATDRGRVYILYGPPSERQTQPSGFENQSRCSEIWFYANFPVVFVDQSCTGRYRQMTFDLTPIRELNIAELSASSKGGRPAPGILQPGSKRFDYEIELVFAERGPKRIAARLRLRLPYGGIWFTSEAKTLRTTFEVAVEVRTAGRELLFENKASFPVSLAEAELAARGGELFTMYIPVDILDEARIAKLGQGKDQLVITVVNATSKEAQKKSIDFN
ncbi:MAG: GWxTD domain-containing protein [Candidatus Aminicenantes bacterium]|nr:GWxTD domain-containing protein [Candidatus Aminicenantes bacterium]